MKERSKNYLSVVVILSLAGILIQWSLSTTRQPFLPDSQVAYNITRQTALVVFPKVEGRKIDDPCLQKTVPDLELRYPTDAYEHFYHIHRLLSNWSIHRHQYLGYKGPKLENYWNSTFHHLASNQTALKENFGNYIPLFVPWMDTFMTNKRRFPQEFRDLLGSALRSDVPYVTVSQHCSGITGYGVLKFRPNILVFSGGGFGHIPIPLLLKELKPNDRPSNKSLHMTFYGTPRNSLRKDVCKFVDEESAVQGWSVEMCTKRKDWLAGLENSTIGLCPRGWGRTSFRLSETIQVGVIPWYVYDDVAWIPYANLWESLGLPTSSIKTFQRDLKEASKWNDTQLSALQIAVSKIQNHFTYSGTMEQIKRYLRRESTDLLCQKHPMCPISPNCSRPIKNGILATSHNWSAAKVGAY